MSAAYVPHNFGSEAESIAQALKGKRSGASFLACCPAHEDRHASLSITQSGDRVLLKCHAGCTQESVIAVLKEQQLWVPRRPAIKATADKTLYVYNDEHGKPLHRTIRTASKDFWQQHHKNGQWISGGGPRVVLYHLDELTTRRSEPVYIAEGEKDVDRLRLLGYLSTCNAMGAGKWRRLLAGVEWPRDCVVLRQ